MPYLNLELCKAKELSHMCWFREVCFSVYNVSKFISNRWDLTKNCWESPSWSVWFVKFLGRIYCVIYLPLSDNFDVALYQSSGNEHELPKIIAVIFWFSNILSNLVHLQCHFPRSIRSSDTHTALHTLDASVSRQTLWTHHYNIICVAWGITGTAVLVPVKIANFCRFFFILLWS